MWKAPLLDRELLADVLMGVRIGVLLAILVLVCIGSCFAQIPNEANRWRMPLTAFAHGDWGPAAPVSTFAAQVHQESAWRADARSPVGALGLTQFMPTTASWISKLYPSELGAGDPYNPLWSLRALVKYDRWIGQRVMGAGSCDQMAAILASYNQGLGWTLKAQKLAGTNQWLNGAERVNPGQAAWAIKESRAYPRRILGELERRYIRAGWGAGSCW
jgi:soluble lytic murein transglycosylase-like protein